MTSSNVQGHKSGAFEWRCGSEEGHGYLISEFPRLRDGGEGKTERDSVVSVLVRAPGSEFVFRQDQC